MTQKSKAKGKRGYKPDHQRRNRAIAAAGTIGAIAAGIGAALKFGWLDRYFPGGDAEHAAPDLAADAPTPGTDRAPEAFRPDPTAAVPASERESLRPATGPAPTLAATRGEMANQTGAAN
ncbi:hypothetical protein [Sphingomonas sp. BK235]|jgi:hypothetical protein|uniref:hypothetical protein n=1 Tax=Sphingomonas sp. BK235 TaxID=2512131 RepID=UPI0010486164|nr:hypothetical protein [Sphingomonas sp. BK235]TCP36654.1 hypothetical protein EV292_101150 [Sphingomonas sp. BK235]